MARPHGFQRIFAQSVLREKERLDQNYWKENQQLKVNNSVIDTFVDAETKRRKLTQKCREHKW